MPPLKLPIPVTSLALLVVLAACSSSAASSSPTSLPSGVSPGASLSCPSELTGLAEEMSRVRADASGTGLGAYTDALASAREAFDGTDFDELDYVCVEAIAAPLAASLADYQKAQARWEACVADDTCSEEEPSSTVTDIFVDASRSLDVALSGLRSTGS